MGTIKENFVVYLYNPRHSVNPIILYMQPTEAVLNAAFQDCTCDETDSSH